MIGVFVDRYEVIGVGQLGQKAAGDGGRITKPLAARHHHHSIHNQPT